MGNPNPYEELARSRKATAIAVMLHREGIATDRARTFDGHQRKLAAAAAQVKPPSQKSWDLVLELLDNLGTPDDPFDGLA